MMRRIIENSQGHELKNLSFITLPLELPPLRMCLIKTLLVKPSGKNLAKEKEYNILYVSAASLKTLSGKTQWDKNPDEGKKSTVH